MSKEMRKVIYSEYVRVDREIRNGSYMDLQEKGEALFHEWGLDYHEFEEGGCSFTVGVLELDNGQIILIEAAHIRFFKISENIMEVEV